MLCVRCHCVHGVAHVVCVVRCVLCVVYCTVGVPVCMVWGWGRDGLSGRAVYLVRTALVLCYCVCAVCFCGLSLRGLSLFLLFRFLFPGLSILGRLFHYPPDPLLMMAITGIFLMGACVLAFAACLVLLTRWIAHRAGMPADEVAVLVTAAVCVLILLGVAMAPVFR